LRVSDRQAIQMACVAVFTRCVYVANTTATGRLLSALIQLLLLIRSSLTIAVMF